MASAVSRHDSFTGKAQFTLTSIVLAPVSRSFLVIRVALSALCVVAVVFCGCSRSSPSAEEILGAGLPNSAADIRFTNKTGFFGGDSYLSATITREEFATLSRELGLQHRPDLLQYWPGALGAQDIAWWTVRSTNDADTLFGEEESTYLVARYESGRVFFKRHIY